MTAPPGRSNVINPVRTGLLACGTIIGLLIVFCLLASVGLLKPDDDGTVSTQAYAKKRSGSPAMGEKGILFSERGLNLPVAVTKDALAALVKADVANDNVGRSQLVASGLVMPVPSGTDVLVLEHDWTGGVRVRLLTGPRAGQTGWTTVESVRYK